MKLSGHRNAVTLCILNKDLLLMKILRKTRVCKSKLYLFPNRRMPSNCHFIMFVDSCSNLLILPSFFFHSFSILSWVTLCCGGCLPVSWSKPLFTRANLNILTMPAPWLWIPGDFFCGASAGVWITLCSTVISNSWIWSQFGDLFLWANLFSFWARMNALSFYE